MSCFSHIVLSTCQLHYWLKHLLTQFFQKSKLFASHDEWQHHMLEGLHEGCQFPIHTPLNLKFDFRNPSMFMLKMPTNSFKFYYLYTFKLLQLPSHFVCHCSF